MLPLFVMRTRIDLWTTMVCSLKCSHLCFCTSTLLQQCNNNETENENDERLWKFYVFEVDWFSLCNVLIRYKRQPNFHEHFMVLMNEWNEWIHLLCHLSWFYVAASYANQLNFKLLTLVECLSISLVHSLSATLPNEAHSNTWTTETIEWRDKTREKKNETQFFFVFSNNHWLFESEMKKVHIVKCKPICKLNDNKMKLVK